MLKKPTQQIDLRVQFSYPCRAFLRAVVSNEPVFQLAHPKISETLANLTAAKWDTNENGCQQSISYYGAIIYNLIISAKRCAFTMPESFWELLRELGNISKGVFIFLFSFRFVLFCVVLLFPTKNAVFCFFNIFRYLQSKKITKSSKSICQRTQ